MNPRAALIIIGNEILSGRTRDANTQFIAKKMESIGVLLSEVRIIPDIKHKIIDSVNILSSEYDYVFTTGGIGPTHDDITTESVAEAFGKKVLLNEEAHNRLKAMYKRLEIELNDARKKMAYIPESAELIDNPVSAAPGFILGNVYVMAGVPYIMQAMLETILPRLHKGEKVYSQTSTFAIGEGWIAQILGELQAIYSNIDIGSYPFEEEGAYHTSVVVRGIDSNIVKEVTNLLNSKVAEKQNSL